MLGDEYKNHGSIRPAYCTDIFIRKEDGSNERLNLNTGTPRAIAKFLERKLEENGRELEVRYEFDTDGHERAHDTKLLRGVEVFGANDDGSIDIGFKSEEWVSEEWAG